MNESCLIKPPASLQQIEAFSKNLDFGMASEPRTGALVAALAAKVERVCQQVGLEPERRAFHPHITLARWKGRRSRELANFLERKRSFASAPFEVREFILFESQLSRHGAHYERVASYPLI